MAPQVNPAYGQRLMPSVVDDLAENNPDRVYAAIPRTANASDGFRDITFADMARSVDFVAGWIENRWGRSTNFETISYIGIPDLRGPIVFLAALLIPSPRLVPSTIEYLMTETGSTKLLFASEIAPLVNKLQGPDPNTGKQALPSMEQILGSTPAKYLYQKQFTAARDDPALVLHSSGSTGLPKAITMTHGSFAALDSENAWPEVPGRRKKDWSMWNFHGEARVYTVFPFFHIAGFLALTMQCIFSNATYVLGPPMMIPDGSLLKAVMQHQKLRALFLPPAVVEQLIREPNGIDFFKGLDFIVYSGAPFNPEIGKVLSKVVNLASPFGSTEVGPLPELEPVDPDDWSWHEFSPLLKHEMRLYDDAEGTFELVLFSDDTTKDGSMLHHNLPGVGEFRTKDLFTQHPEKPQLYQYYGRRDDIIVLANGEKFNPIPLEMSVQNHDSLKGVFVTGNGRTQASLVIEPKEPLESEEQDQLVDQLWPLIEKANALVPGQGRIRRGKVLCARPNKPFFRTGKNTIIRKLTEDVYREEIEGLYSGAPSNQKTVTVQLVPSVVKTEYSLPDVVTFLRSVLRISFDKADSIGEDEDLFSHGLDSVQTLEIVSNLKRNLQKQTTHSVAWISPRTTFLNSTLGDLGRHLQAFLHDSQVPDQGITDAQASAVDKAVAKHVENLPKTSAMTKAYPLKVSTVAVLGSTGYLGTRLVASLLESPTVSSIYCLNRSVDARTRQEAALHELGGNVAENVQRLHYIQVELGQPSLGMSGEDYDRVIRDVDVFIYNAWRLDFGLALRSFDPFLIATRDIIELAVFSRRHMRIVFVSSLASVFNLAVKGTAPEDLVEDAAAAINTGYGQSKLAAERILTTAGKQCGILLAIARVGQVGGPSLGQPGAWADQPWISALAKTSKTIGAIPQEVASVDWIPVDVAATMLRDISLMPSEATEGIRVYHINHPQPQPWQLFISTLCRHTGELDTVSLGEWVQKLREITEPSLDQLSSMPALKMLDFYDNFGSGVEAASYATERGIGTSPVEIPPLQEELLASWLGTWNL